MKGLGVETVAIFVLFQCSIAPVRRGLIAEVSQWHSDTSHSVGHLWASDRPVVETFTRQTPLTTNRYSYPPARFEPILILSCNLRPGLPSSLFSFSSTHHYTLYLFIVLRPPPPTRGSCPLITYFEVRELLSYGVLRSEWWRFITDVSGQPSPQIGFPEYVGTIFPLFTA
jgi:hypothetical protein